MMVTREVTESERLEWLIMHRSAEFDFDRNGMWLTFWESERGSPDGVSGRRIVRGPNERECINAAILGNSKRID